VADVKAGTYLITIQYAGDVLEVYGKPTRIVVP